MTLRRIAALAALLTLCLAAALHAQEPTPAELFEQWDREATIAEEVLATDEASTPALEVLRESLVAQRIAARDMVARQTTQLDPLKKQLEALGPPPADGAQETAEIATLRADLTQKIDGASGRLKKAELALTRVDGLIKKLDSIIRARFTGQLLTTGPSPLSPWRWPGAIAEYIGVGARLVTEAERAFAEPVAEKTRETRLPLIGLGIFAALVLQFWVRRTLATTLRGDVGPEAGRGRRLWVGLVVATTRLIGIAIAAVLLLLALRHSGLLGLTAMRLQPHFGEGLLALVGAYALGQALFAPSLPELRIVPLPDAEARRGGWLTIGLGFLLFADSLVVKGGADIGLGTATLAVANLPLVLAGGVMLFRLSYVLRPRPAPPGAEAAPDVEAAQRDLIERTISAGVLFMRVAAVVAPVLAAAGYFAASRFLLYPTVMTAALVAAAVLLFIAIREGVDVYLEEAETEGGGLRMLPILFGFLVFCAALPLLALIWGARTADLTEWWRIVAEGLTVGDVTVSPLDFITFALIFTIGYTLTRLVQGVLRTSVLPKTSMTAGARVATVSGIGYIGFFLAALAAISSTGLDLSNLAIVAGALSVGIGFGLQNIVNNFVSGIILLIERPIKIGDWIDVGGKQGYVTRISVRATEIQTFDRAELIVPNSELISTTVLNMTHSDTIGRVHVPVGVAYGSDTRKVEAILSEIAKSHPMVLKRPPPIVVFHGFGADSLDFEIRAFLRDVNYVLVTKSDMNYEVERRFREEGIEIPFAQRDLHIKNVDALGQTIRAAISSPRGRTRMAESAPEVAALDSAPEAGAAEPKPRRRRPRGGAAADKV